jgi:hypothetical protein
MLSRLSRVRVTSGRLIRALGGPVSQSSRALSQAVLPDINAGTSTGPGGKIIKTTRAH